MNVLAVGAHHDDVEIGCGGALAKLILDGHTVFVRILTNSCTTTLNQRTPQQARRESNKALRALGVPKSHVWDPVDLKSGYLSYSTPSMQRLERFIMDKKPHLQLYPTRY